MRKKEAYYHAAKEVVKILDPGVMFTTKPNKSITPASKKVIPIDVTPASKKPVPLIPPAQIMLPLLQQRTCLA